jgi:hypothetical protein
VIYLYAKTQNHCPVSDRNTHAKSMTLKKITPPTINIKPNSKAATNSQSAFFPASGEPK